MHHHYISKAKTSPRKQTVPTSHQSCFRMCYFHRNHTFNCFTYVYNGSRYGSRSNESYKYKDEINTKSSRRRLFFSSRCLIIMQRKIY